MTQPAPLATISDLDQFKASGFAPPASYPTNLRTFYAPIDNVHGALEAVVGSAKHSIAVAMYGYDDDDLAAMLDAALRNPLIFVQISLDKSQAGGVHEKAILAKYHADMTGNRVAIGVSEKNAIMHRKMVVVDGLWRVSGSTNWSASGEDKQDNELTILLDATACAEARTVLDLEHQAMLAQMNGPSAAN